MSTFSTLNESSLHKTLKNIYCIQNEGTTEVDKNGYIYDILTKEGKAIEIQTQNLSALLPKILTSLQNSISIKIVHPVIIKRVIEVYDDEGNRISRRTSPNKGCIYDIFRELTGIYPVLITKGFELEIIEIESIEKRLRTENPVQTKNRQRRFKKNWIKTDKELKEILNTRTFSSKKDYLNLIPAELEKSFTSAQLKTALINNGFPTRKISADTSLMLWVLTKMQLVTRTKQGRAYLYSINN